jgi:hypothetical protein
MEKKTTITFPVKVQFGEDYRRFTFVGSSFSMLVATLKETCGIDESSPILVKYKDDEGDFIIMSSDQEMLYAHSLAKDSSPVRLFVTSQDSPEVHATCTAHGCILPPGVYLDSPVPPFHKIAFTQRPKFCNRFKANLRPRLAQAKQQWRQQKRAAAQNMRQFHRKHREQWRMFVRQQRQTMRQQRKALREQTRALNSRFVKHVTCDDNSEYGSGVSFTKTWRLRNSGSTAWPEGTILLQVSRERTVQAPDSVPLPKAIQPGEEIDISVPFTTPSEPGRYMSFWRLQAPSQQKFGQRIRCMFRVMTLSDEETTPVEQPATGSQPASVYPNEVAQLEEMGFAPRPLLIKLLKKHKGKVHVVVQDLIKRIKTPSGISDQQ